MVSRSALLSFRGDKKAVIGVCDVDEVLCDSLPDLEVPRGDTGNFFDV